MKQYSFDQLKTVAHTLIQTNGATTTLEVKQVLRSMGFIASQQDVSRDMDNLTSMGYNYVDNGKFRIYTDFVPKLQLQMVATRATKKQSKKQNKQSAKTKEVLYVTFEMKNGKETNFKSYRAESRDAARKIHAQKNSVNYMNVRARLHGNPALKNR